MRRRDRRVAALSRRVRVLEALLAPKGPQFQGPRLTEGSLREAYEAMRQGGARFIELRVHPDLADHALGVLSNVDLRALTLVTRAEDLLPGGWELVEQQQMRVRTVGGRIVGG